MISNGIVIVQAELVQNFEKGFKMETGVKGVFRESRSVNELRAFVVLRPELIHKKWWKDRVTTRAFVQWVDNRLPVGFFKAGCVVEVWEEGDKGAGAEGSGGVGFNFFCR